VTRAKQKQKMAASPMRFLFKSDYIQRKRAHLRIIILSKTHPANRQLRKFEIKKNCWWTRRDLNPRPPRCQRGDHTRLIYSPNSAAFLNL
jgi:hypothetical protein